MLHETNRLQRDTKINVDNFFPEDHDFYPKINEISDIRERSSTSAALISLDVIAHVDKLTRHGSRWKDVILSSCT